MTAAAIIADAKTRMGKAIDALKHDFNGLRTARASTDLLAPVTVEAYGSRVPVQQVANINVADTRLLTVQVWDGTLLAAVEKAIRESGLGLNPQTDGNTLRLRLPELTEDRRKELIKLAKKYAEDSRVAIRNIRRDANDAIKKLEKDGQASEDDVRRNTDDIQKVTDQFVKQVDDALAAKESDITKV